MPRTLTVTTERWELTKPFTISSATQTHALDVLVEITEDGHTGRGEAAGVSYRGETVDSVAADIEAVRGRIEDGLGPDELQTVLPPGGARNAVDCALWDLEAKRSGQSIWGLLDIRPRPVTTVYTVGIDRPERMAADAAAHADFPVLKVKVGSDDPLGRIAAVHAAAPGADIVIDVNQGWALEELQDLAPRMGDLGVRMIEQPLPADCDGPLEDLESPVALCADESCQVSGDLEALRGRYSLVNIKLDKTGGLTEALRLARHARRMGFELMVGNMLGTSLAMAPAFVIAQFCRYVDIDGPLLQTADREHSLRYTRGQVAVPERALWG